MTYVLGGNVLATVTIYKDYGEPIAKSIDGKVEQIDISHVGSKTSSARINKDNLLLQNVSLCQAQIS